MILIQFSEVKSTVLKPTKQEALFEMCLTDVEERFKLGLYMTVIYLYHHLSGSGVINNTEGSLYMFQALAAVYLSEIVVDWVKHTSIINYTKHPAMIYDDFGWELARILQDLKKYSFLTERCREVTRKIGFYNSAMASGILALSMVSYLSLGSWYLNLGTLLGVYGMLHVVYFVNKRMILLYRNKYAEIEDNKKEEIKARKSK